MSLFVLSNKNKNMVVGGKWEEGLRVSLKYWLLLASKCMFEGLFSPKYISFKNQKSKF